jgi:hypothetical protein
MELNRDWINECFKLKKKDNRNLLRMHM